MDIGYGIDFGTSTSAIIVVDAEGNVTRISDPESAQSSYTFPSCALMTEDGRLVVGTTAERLGRLRLSAFRSQFKREFRSTVPAQLGDRTVRTDELVTALLAHLRKCALDRIPGPAKRVVITVPASWDEVQRNRMRDAAEAAGFDPATVVLLPEPVAALRYAFDKDLILGERYALVYDLGGGTFDCALAHGSTGEGYTVVGQPGGRPDVGGVDFTTALMQMVALERDPPQRAWLQADPDDDDGTRRFLNFRDECESAKRALSVVASTTLHLPAGDPVEVDQETLDGAIGPMLDDTIAACEELLRSADLTWDDVGQVVPVGGSTRLKLIAKLLQDHSDRIVKVAEPELAVALGAALHAKDLLNEAGTAVEEPAAEPDADEATATHATVPLSTAALPTAAEAPPFEDHLGDFDFGRRRHARAPRNHWDTGKISWAMLGSVAALGGFVQAGLWVYHGFAGWLDAHSWPWVPGGWVAGVTGTLCLLAGLYLVVVTYVYVVEERPRDHVCPWLTVAYLAVGGAVVWGRLDGWGDAAIPIALLLNLAVIAYIVAVEHVSNSMYRIGDQFGDTFILLITAGGVALFTWWSALAYGRLAAWTEPRVWDFLSTGWIGGVVGTLAAVAAVFVVLWGLVFLDDVVSLRGVQMFSSVLCLALAAAAVIVGYNVSGPAGLATAFGLANAAAAAFLAASTD
ncbi:Hsp70 protein [Glycomyces sambucus]|uniref:Hsp70 protein n=1 Tax=Glycomyces sambucus TaxID=380244 RepID=A0A1G9D1T9_9ACTN|nr:Hsp70 family protein [Glycomyces sambucus]SDK57839.1 Hsp70 protein [Glycomyces sambucus]